MEKGPPCQNFFQVDAVFIGSVHAIVDETLDRGGYQVSGNRVEFSIHRALRGITGLEATVHTGKGGGDCGFRFQRGMTYVVYASRTSAGLLETGICTRTEALSAATDDLRFFETLPANAAGARVFGVVVHNEVPLDGGIVKGGPIPDVLLTLRGPNGIREARTDAQGRYDMSGIQPGKYELTTVPPSEFSGRHTTRVVDLPDVHACHEANLSLNY